MNSHFFFGCEPVSFLSTILPSFMRVIQSTYVQRVFLRKNLVVFSYFLQFYEINFYWYIIFMGSQCRKFPRKIKSPKTAENPRAPRPAGCVKQCFPYTLMIDDPIQKLGSSSRLSSKKLKDERNLWLPLISTFLSFGPSNSRKLLSKLLYFEFLFCPKNYGRFSW